MRTYVLIACGIALAGCATDQSCASRPTDILCQDVDGGGADAGHADTGVDGGPTGDAHAPCGGACGAMMQCLVSTDTCVACLSAGDCDDAAPVCDTAGDHTCVGCVAEGDCTATGTHCEAVSRTCVACLDGTQCTTAAAARCEATTHACGACHDDADCAHLSDTPVCGAAGACVRCTAANETACGLNSCNPATNTCTTTLRTTIPTCHACVADSECLNAMDRCVPMQFMGADHGSYCLHLLSAGCTRPFGSVSPSRVSTSGAPATTYCTLDESATTCEAYNALVDDTACTMPGDCGASGLADGRCEMVGAFANRCTYSCGTASDCPPGKNCGAGYCGS